MFLVLTGIFCLFASFGLTITLMDVRHASISLELAIALDTGLLGVLIVWAISRVYLKLVVVFIVIHTIAVLSISRMAGPGHALLAGSPANFLVLERLTRISAAITTFLIIAGYSLISTFMRNEGMRVLSTVTEMRLASEIHRALVPPLSCTTGAFQICGSSTPSGHMGGDLVDVIEHGERWTAYVADVSGHGVPAGMIMAMVKSAVRTGSTSGENMAATLANLNRVLASLSASNVFITLAYISGEISTGNSKVQFSLAGHLPILHYRKRLGSVEERTVSNLPLAVLPDTNFQTAWIECEPGDLLAVLTDGFTEVSNSGGEELGLEAFKTVLLGNSDAELETILTSLHQTAARHGKQTDDQTVLLVRRLP